MAVDILAPATRPAHAASRPRLVGAGLLDAVPFMHGVVPARDRELADRVLVARMETFEPGEMALPDVAGPGHPFAVVITRGAILRRTLVGGRTGAELLGASDIIETRLDDEPSTLASRTEYVVQQPTSVAILDDRVRLAARRWPALHRVIADQHARQARRASRHLAALALPRVESRVLALFCDLADRWGRMTPDGIRIDLPLTHSVIGQLVAAQRPTVSLALTELAAAGTVVRQADRSWLLAEGAVVTA